MAYAAKHGKAVARQVRALKRLGVLVALVVFLALAAAGTEIGLHGWAHFANRPAGVGGSPQAPDDGPAPVVPVKPVPHPTVTPSPPAAPTPTPPPRRRHVAPVPMVPAPAPTRSCFFGGVPAPNIHTC